MILIFLLLILIILFIFYNKSDNFECSIDNPYNNMLVTETENSDDICENNDDDYNFYLYKNLKDIYNTENTSRQFYKLPNSNIGDNYGEWLYKTEKNCKIDERIVYKILT